MMNVIRLMCGITLISLSACTCDQRFIFTNNPCHYDIYGCEEMTPCYNEHKAQWKADLKAGRITEAEYWHNLGYQ